MADKLSVTSAEYLLRQEYAEMRLVVDGKKVTINTYGSKLTMRKKGFVFLGDVDFSHLEHEIPFDSPVKLRGWTNNPTVLALYDQFVRDTDRGGHFVEGPVSIPKIEPGGGG